MSSSLPEEDLAAIVESSDDAIVGKDLKSVITSWNRGAERLFGYAAAEAIGQPIAMIIPPDRIDEEDCVVSRVTNGVRVAAYETVRRRKDGSTVEVATTVSPIRDGLGAIVGTSTIAREITDRARARPNDADSGDRLAFLAEVGEILSSSLDYVQTLDRAVHLALPRLGDYCNVLLVDDTGVLRHVACGHVVREKEAIVERLAKQAMADRRSPALPTFAEAVITSRRTLMVSHDEVARRVAQLDKAAIDPELVALGEALAPWAYIGTPLLVLGRAAGVMSFATTATESRREYARQDETLVAEFARRASTAIENARLFRQAEDLSRLKDEFLATLSHELRTPLSAILGWARLLANDQLDGTKRRHAVDAILRNAQAQSQLVDDVLDVARGMAGNLRLDMAPLDLVVPAQRGVEAVAPAAAAKRIAIELHAPAAVPIIGDVGRLQQIVWNLLSNAVKFTPTGGRVVVEVAEAQGTAQLQVTDTGVGIAPSFLPFVFDKFRQADGSATRQHGGLGLGLAIARHLAEMHGGSIDANSGGEGRGATFRMRLPLRESEATSVVGHTNNRVPSEMRGNISGLDG
jgi:PAS domain S-box-containing protein